MKKIATIMEEPNDGLDKSRNMEEVVAEDILAFGKRQIALRGTDFNNKFQYRGVTNIGKHMKGKTLTTHKWQRGLTK